MLTAADILSVADAYAAACEPPASLTTVSFRAFGDSKKLQAMRDGADLTLKRAATALEWFSLNWPSNAVWPDGVARPSIHPEAAE